LTQYNKITQAAQPNTASVGVGGVEFGQNVSDDQKSNSQKPTKLVPARGKAFGLEKENTPDLDPDAEFAIGLLENTADPNDQENGGTPFNSASDRARAKRLGLS